MAAMPTAGQSTTAGPFDPDYLALEKAQNEANSKSGPRFVPSRVLPVPKSASSRLQEIIAQPYALPKWTANHPQRPADWKAVVDVLTAASLKTLPDVRKKLGVSIEPTKIADVPVFILTPERLLPENRDRVLLHIHAGGFVYFPGESGTLEATLMAAYGGYKVISVDYRLAPDFPYPAALDDVTAVYKALIKDHDPRKIAVFGSSAGASLTLALMLRAKAEGLALPAAIAPGTPWSDVTKAGGGDTMQTLEWIDGNLVSYNGYISHSALAYANGRDPADPYISPLHGDFADLPPAILTSGTRDLFLSLTVLTHRKLRQAGIDAQLHVFEGLAHAQYFDPWAPESKEAFSEIGAFFDRHLAR
jgi:acetyl esterase/lipase